jgi:hypothetical protein
MRCEEGKRNKAKANRTQVAGSRIAESLNRRIAESDLSNSREETTSCLKADEYSSLKKFNFILNF